MKPAAFFPVLVLPLLATSQYTYQQLQVNYLENDAQAKTYTFASTRYMQKKDSGKTLKAWASTCR